MVAEAGWCGGFFTHMSAAWAGMARLAGWELVRPLYCLMANLGFLTAWWFQDCWTSYMVADFSLNEYSRRQEVEAASLEIVQHHFFHILLWKQFLCSPRFKGKSHRLTSQWEKVDKSVAMFDNHNIWSIYGHAHTNIHIHTHTHSVWYILT